MTNVIRRILLLGMFFVALVACDDDGSTVPEPQPPGLRPLTAPENLVYNIEVLYNDEVRTAAERRIEYEKLLAPPAGRDTCRSFFFEFMAPDEQGTPDLWGRDQEIQAHANIFQSQASGEIYSLALEIEVLPPEDLNNPERPGWKEVFATNVHLRLLTNPYDGFEVIGGQEIFRTYPAGEHWVIGEWIELPRPAFRQSWAAVEPTSWGRIKAAYLR